MLQDGKLQAAFIDAPQFAAALCFTNLVMPQHKDSRQERVVGPELNHRIIGWKRPLRSSSPTINLFQHITSRRAVKLQWGRAQRLGPGCLELWPKRSPRAAHWLRWAGRTAGETEARREKAGTSTWVPTGSRSVAGPESPLLPLCIHHPHARAEQEAVWD